MKDRISTPSKAGRVLITPEDGSAPFYAVLSMADEPLEEGTALVKANLLRDQTAEKFGFGPDAVPDDALSLLGTYNQHWWRWRRYVEGEVPPGYTLKPAAYYEAEPTKIESEMTLGRYTSIAEIHYGTEISVSEEGAVTIVDAQTETVTAQSANGSDVAVGWAAEGRFFQIKGTETVWFGAADCTVSVVASFTRESDCVVRMTGVQEVDPYLRSAGIGEWDYIQSNDRNLFPDSGIEEGYEYVYLGVPFRHSVEAAEVELVSYEGTGTFGQDNPCSVTLNVRPQVVFVEYFERVTNTGGYTYDAKYSFDLLYAGRDLYIEENDGNLSAPLFVKSVSLEDTTLRWCHAEDAQSQYNAEGYHYRLVAIGYRVKEVDG